MIIYFIIFSKFSLSFLIKQIINLDKAKLSQALIYLLSSNFTLILYLYPTPAFQTGGQKPPRPPAELRVKRSGGEGRRSVQGVGQGGGRIPPLARLIDSIFARKWISIVSLPRVFLHEVRRETAKRAFLNFGRILRFFTTRNQANEPKARRSE